MNFRIAGVFSLMIGLLPATCFAQQVVQRGPFGKPTEVMDETQQWTTPLLVSADRDVEIYIPDVTSPDWLKANYPDYEDKGQYVLSLFTLYKTTKACKTNQVGWGNSDGAHLDACNAISYRVRQASIDANQKTVTLIMAAMVGEDGEVQPDSIERSPVTRNWAELDQNTQTALRKAAGLIAEQMRIYDRKVQNLQ